MEEIKQLLPYLMTWNTYADIAIIAFVLYKVMVLIRETRAEQLVKGIAVILIILKFSEFMGLHTVFWVLKNTMTVGMMAILVIFQPELRRALEHIGRGKFVSKQDMGEFAVEEFLNEIILAVAELAKEKIGALIVLEQETGINEYIETGVKLDSLVSRGLLINIFVPNTPLHDGAIIIRKNRIAAAGCFLPLTENKTLNKELGTRHRAALGITETSDAFCIIVSEETGIISLAHAGKITRYLDAKSLKEILKNKMKHEEKKQNSWFRRGDKNE